MSSAVFFLLLSFTALVTAEQMLGERSLRQSVQEEAEVTFRAQPDRHPHRMVHYGHYVFRTPPPLSVLDPGLLLFTGSQVFLEGHRQNTPMINAADAQTGLGGLPPWTPALCYQLFAPILLVVLGYSAVVREREAGTLATLLAQGVSGIELVFGKFIALLAVSGVLLLPAFVAGAFAAVAGAEIAAVAVLLLVYFGYLALWSALVVLVSSLLKQRSQVLNSLLAAWLVSAVAIPSIGVGIGSTLPDAKGKIELDLAMQAELIAAGDGHNVNDPAFIQLRSELLDQYDVNDVAQLPVNIRGVVSERSEAAQTEILNRFADQRLTQEQAVAAAIRRFGWLSPSVALSFASRSIAGTDLQSHHRFQERAEALRFEFVQGLNRLHAEQLDYQTDIERNSGPEASRRARVSAENWSVLSDFHFETVPFSDRLATAGLTLAMLLTWLVASLIAMLCAGWRLAV